MRGRSSEFPAIYHLGRVQEFVAEVGGVVSTGAFVVRPERLEMPATTGNRQGWGVATQLYSARRIGRGLAPGPT